MSKRFLIILAVLTSAVCVGLTFAINAGGWAGGEWIWIKTYREVLRIPLFSAFLTVGSFLLTLQATILLRIKEIYDDEEYEADWKNFQMQEEVEGRVVKSGYYDPLRNLGIALLANVLLALCSAFLQVTLGFIPAPWAVGTCLGFAAMTLGLLLFLWWQIAVNLVRWFAVIERKHSRTASASTSEKKKSAGPML